jgi:hypothetical protein
MHYVYLYIFHYNISALGDNKMAGKPTKNDALEALDFIINVLKEHEKDLDRLINQLGIITENLGETGELTVKIEKLENRITSLQGEITNLMKHHTSPRDSPSYKQKTPMSVECKKWEDFKSMATGAETVTYCFKEEERSFQADAIANGRVISYTGEFPQYGNLLRLWLSRELDVAEESIFEGSLHIP